jgi:hypothetical protein
MASSSPSHLPLAALGAVVALALGGCPSINTYGTPRTIPIGRIQHTLAVDTIGFMSPSRSVTTATGTTTTSDARFYPNAPTYQLRYGLTDRVDLGFRLGNLTSPGIDAKFNLVRGAFDLTIMPGAQAVYVTLIDDLSLGVVYLHLPVILGFNLSRGFSLVATPGISGAFVFAGSSSGSSTNGSGFAARLGLGANIRVTEGFTIHPEVTALYFPESGGVIYTPSVAFSFGAMPNFNDL